MRKISKRLQKAMGLSNIVSLAASPIVARKRVSDSPFVSKKVITNALITLLIWTKIWILNYGILESFTSNLQVSQVKVSTISSPIVGHKRTSMKTENEKTRKGSSGNEKTRKGSSGSFQRYSNSHLSYIFIRNILKVQFVSIT